MPNEKRMKWGASGLLVLALATAGSVAQTIYVDAADPSMECPCVTDPQTLPSDCGTQGKPYSCISNAIDHPVQAGDTIQAAAGTYDECVRIDRSGTIMDPIRIVSEVSRGALIARDPAHWQCATQVQTVLWKASYVSFEGFRVTNAADHTALQFFENVANETVGNTVSDVEVSGSQIGILLTAQPATADSANRIENSVVHDNVSHGIHVKAPGVELVGVEAYGNGNGVRVEGADGTLIDAGRFHHNRSQGILEGANGTIIQNAEIDNNGEDPLFHHGLYLTGQNGSGSPGRLENNRIHHNASFGVHLYPSPANWIVERNEIYSNGFFWELPTDLECNSQMNTFFRAKGGGMVVADAVDVTVRYNVVHHNVTKGIVYDAGSGGDSGNLFHHNTVYANGGRQIVVTDTDASNVEFKNNLVVGPDPAGPNFDYLVVVANSTLDDNVFDGNLYHHPPSTSSTLLFSWNGTSYSFDDLASLVQDEHSIWEGDYRFVDPDMSPLLEDGVNSNGDYHLRVGSAATQGVCCVNSAGALDVDGESVSPSCTEDCVSAGLGIGADFYLDGDGDDTADRYDCDPQKSNNSKVCEPGPDPGDGDGVPASFESSHCGHPGAPYLSSIYPRKGPSAGAPEVCDGNDNDCDGSAAGEEDDDLDGSFPSCGPAALQDCDDTESRVYGGSQEVCDGIDNDCGATELDEPDVDTDGDGYFDCLYLPGVSPLTKSDCDPLRCCANPSADEICANGLDDNCDGQTDETPCGPDDCP